MANVSTLRYWNGDGANHLLLVLDNCTTVSPDQGGGCNLAPVDRVGRAIVARQTFPAGSFRPGFDYVMPVSEQLEYGLHQNFVGLCYRSTLTMHLLTNIVYSYHGFEYSILQKPLVTYLIHKRMHLSKIQFRT